MDPRLNKRLGHIENKLDEILESVRKWHKNALRKETEKEEDEQA